MEKMHYLKNDLIFKKGDAADGMFHVMKGKVRILSDNTPDATELSVLKDGDFFGQMGVVDHAPRSAAAVADSAVELMFINADSFPKFVAGNPSDTVVMLKNLSSGLRKTTKKLLDATKTVNNLVDSDEANLDKKPIWQRLKSAAALYKEMAHDLLDKSPSHQTHFAAGETIFIKGQHADCLYKILKGQVDFYNALSASGTPFVTLKSGEIFGEMGVLEGENRSATAVAASDTEIMPITSGQLAAHFESVPDDAFKILKNLSVHLRKTNEDYLRTLQTIDELVKDSAEELFSNKDAWNGLTAYSREYNLMLAAAPTMDNMYLYF